jgi:multimeric flavodoxin WrbA
VIIEPATPSARHVLALFCSSRRGGNTDILLEEFLRGCEEAGARVERFYASQLQMNGCLSCGGCDTTGRCVVKDDMQAVYAALEQSQLVVLASPIYFYSVPAQAKAVIDRSQAFWSRKYRLKQTEGTPPGTGPARKGFFLSVGATRGKRMFEGVCLTIRYFFDAIDASYEGELLYRGSDGKGDIRNHPTAMKECYEAGLKFASA